MGFYNQMEMTNLENMITVKNLRKEFKKTIKEPGIKGSIKSFFNPKSEIVEAVKDISFTAEKGEILGFIGPNGAGKSTVIKMLTGILTPTSGTCVINGQNPQDNRKKYVKRNRCGIRTTHPALVGFTAYGNLYGIKRNLRG